MPQPLIRATAAFGLPGKSAPATLDEDGLAAVQLEGLAGLLWQAVEDGVVTDGEVIEVIAQGQSAAMRWALRLEQRLLEVWVALKEAEVPCRVLKGPAVAHLDYPVPEWRPFTDIDLLVPGDRLDRAVAVVEAMGGRRIFAEPRPGYAARFAKAVTIRLDDGPSIDLHRTLAEGPYGQTIVAADLFDQPETFTLAECPVLALRPEARFVHAGIHAVLGRPEPELRPLRDLAQIDRRPGLDHDLVLSLARRWHVEAVLARAVVLVEDLLDVESPLTGWAWAHRPDRFERRALPAYHGPQAGYRRKVVATLPAIDGLRNRARFLAALLIPDRAYLREREGTTGRRLGTALTEWRRAHHPHGGGRSSRT